MDAYSGSVHCMTCGYDLAGSALRGDCPECGSAYNVESGEGVVSADTLAQTRGDRVLMWLKVGVLGGLGMTAIAVGAIAAVNAADWTRPMTVGGGVGGALLAMAAMVWLIDVLERRQR